MSILSAEHIVFGYSLHRPIVLNDISVSAEKGEVIALLGPNGVGKSTLLNLLCGLIKPLEGHVFLNSTDISHLSTKQIAQHIGYVPQHISLSFDYSVKDYVMLGRTSHMGVLSMPNDKDHYYVEQALSELDLKSYMDRPVNMLSGGEKQKVSIARALAQEPEIIVFDEPTSALDFGNQIKVLSLIKKLMKKKYTVIMTTHNPDHPLILNCTTWILFGSGKLISAPAKDIITSSTLKELYGDGVGVLNIECLNRSACFISLDE